MVNLIKSLQSKLSSAGNAALPSKDAPFLPILPFSTASDLGALYILGRELGRGQTGIIRSCTSRSSGTSFACKSISKRTCDAEDVVREVCIMKHLSNPQASHRNSPHSQVCRNIVRLKDVIEDQTHVHLIMELCSGGELFNRIRKQKCFPEAEAALVVKSLLETVEFCHSMGIMHRDIKPENILLVEDADTSSIKLADFGLALEFFPGQKFSGLAGSSYYLAPEVLQGEYSEEIDMWSVGVILHILLCGFPPFRGATEQRIFQAIRKGELSLSSSPWDAISASAKNLVTQMLHPDAKSRLTPAQALSELHHNLSYSKAGVHAMKGLHYKLLILDWSNAEHPWIAHHTKNAQHIQVQVPPSCQPVSTILGQHRTAKNFSSQRSSSSSSRSQTVLQAGSMDDVKPELSKILGDSKAGTSRRDTFSLIDTLASQRWQCGWTCFIISVSGSEETVVVDTGREKYMVSHDRMRRTVGWKLLKDEPGLASCTRSTSSQMSA